MPVTSPGGEKDRPKPLSRPKDALPREVAATLSPMEPSRIWKSAEPTETGWPPALNACALISKLALDCAMATLAQASKARRMDVFLMLPPLEASWQRVPRDMPLASFTERSPATRHAAARKCPLFRAAFDSQQEGSPASPPGPCHLLWGSEDRPCES